MCGYLQANISLFLHHHHLESSLSVTHLPFLVQGQGQPMFSAIKSKNYCKPTWGSSGILRGGSTEVSSWSCADEFFSVLSTMVLGRLSIPEIKLPKDLKGWLILSFTFKIMETSESCQTTVTTIITERRQWVKRFCLFSFFSSLTMSSLLHSSSIMSSLTELSTSVFKVSNAEANSDDSVPSFSDSICWCWRNEFGFQIYTLKKQRQTLEGDEKEWNHH